MKKPREVSLHKLKEACRRLGEGVGIAKTELDQDGVIQRFEFTFELSWKALRILFEEKGQGLEARSPKDSLKVAFRMGLIKGEEERLFLNMLEDRNTASHVYDKNEAEAIFARVRDSYLPAIQNLISRLERES